MRTAWGAAFFVCMLGGTGACAQVSFRGLGTLSPDLSSFVHGLSPDGRAPVGRGMGYNPDGSTSGKPVAWPDGIVQLQGSPEYWDGNAYGASTGGATVVGWGQIGTGGPGTSVRAFRATATGVEHLPGLAPEAWTYAYGVTPDGGVIVGSSEGTACVWVGDAAPVALATPSGATSVRAEGVSADASLIAGTFRRDGFLEFALWDGGALTELPLGAGRRFTAGAQVALDGGTVIGSYFDGLTGPGSFVWTAEEGLRTLPGASSLRCISGDGSVMGGTTAGINAALWFGDELVRADELLAALGIDLTGWSLTSVTGISADGLTIAGTGQHRYGPAPGDVRTEGWVAVIPGPGAVLVLGLGAGMCSRRRRNE